MTYFYAVYDPATGTILRTGFCSQAADVALQARAGEAVIAADRLCPSAAFTVDVALTPPAIVARS
jgi:hypothetical protein